MMSLSGFVAGRTDQLGLVMSEDTSSHLESMEDVISPGAHLEFPELFALAVVLLEELYLL